MAEIKGTTRFADWLRDQGMSCDVFVALYDLPRKSIFFLADPTRYSLPVKSIPTETLKRVAEIVGLQPGDLINDVVDNDDVQDSGAAER